MPARIIIGADLVPTESNYSFFKDGNVKELIGEELEGKLKSADFTIFNLEVPLTGKPHPIVKCGPNLIAPASTIKGLKEINPHFFGLANNHILDQGKEGLRSTISVLDKAGILHCGAGENLSEASAPYIAEINGIKIGIYCCAEHEFTIASENNPGANPFDPLESPDHVTSLKKQTDYVIVLYHGGKEHYRYPSPHLQKVCRKLADKGADLVVCQHSHCIGAAENWNGGTIIYGQGNFLFDGSDSDFWQTSLLIDLNLVKEKAGNTCASINYIPVCKRRNMVREAGNDDAKKILEGFSNRSREIKDPEIVRRYYQRFADKMLDDYLYTLSGKKNLFYRVLNKISHYRYYKTTVRKKYSKSSLAAVRNYTECEAHSELLLQGINDRLHSGAQEK